MSARRDAPRCSCNSVASARDVQMRVDVHRRSAQATSVDQRRVVQRVGKDCVAAADERRNDSDVCRVSARECQRLFGLEVLGELGLERDMLRIVSGDQPRGTGANAVLLDRVCRRLGETRMGGESKVVVGREIDRRSEFCFDNGAFVPRNDAEGTLEVALAQRVQSRPQGIVERHAAGGLSGRGGGRRVGHDSR